MAVRFQLRRDTAANWASANSVLALGEPGVETDTLKVKVGDGSTAWNSLAYSITKDFTDLTSKPTTLAGYGITDSLALNALSVTQNAASGNGTLTYNNATGVFSYTPPDFEGLTGNFTGSVFADDSTLIVDGVNSTLNATVLTGALPAIDGSALTGVDADTLDGVDSSSYLRSDAFDRKTSGNLLFENTIDAVFGNDENLSISSNGYHGFIVNNENDLFIRNNDTNGEIILQGDDGTGFPFIPVDYLIIDGASGGVKLYGNYGDLKLQTVAAGVDVTGDLTVTGSVITSQIDSSDSSAIEIQTDVTMLAGLTVGNHIIPSSNENIDLGSNTNRFRELFLSGNTISLDNIKLSCVPATGTLQIHNGNGTLKNIQSHNINANDITANDIAVGGNLTMTGYIAGPATMTIDPAAVGDNTGTLVVAGNLQVDGTTTTINSQTLEVEDKNVVLGPNAANDAANNGAGLTVTQPDTSDASLIYNTTDAQWEFNKSVNISSANELTLSNLTTTNATIQNHYGNLFGVITNYAANSFRTFDITTKDTNTFNDGDTIRLNPGNLGSVVISRNASTTTDFNQYTGVAGTSNQQFASSLDLFAAIFNPEAAQSLWHAGTKKFETTATGIDVTGTVTATEINLDATGDIHSTVDTGYVGIAGGTNSYVGANALFYGGTHATLAGVTKFRSGSTETVTILANGTVGVGTTDLDSWSTVFDGRVRLGATGFVGSTSASTQLGNNWYYDGSAYKRIADDYALRYYQNGGDHVWETAVDNSPDSTITWVTKMFLGSNGNLEIGYAGAARQQADSQALSIITPASGGGQGIALKRLDSNNDQGLGEISWSNNTQDGLANIRVKTDGAVNTTDMLFETSAAGALISAIKIDGSREGNVGIGPVDPLARLHVDRSTSDNAQRTIYADGTHDAITTNGTNYLHNVWIENHNFDIDSGVTDSGYRIGLNIEGYHDSGELEGTLATQKNIWSRNGNNSGGTGTITNSYNLHLETLSGGGITITNNYGLYQTGAGTKNYFEGDVGIGTSGPTAKLEVKGSGGGTGLTLKTTDASSNEVFYVQDGGRVGLNYWPLTVGIPSGTAAATNAKFQVEEAGLLTVLTNGNVGIGNTDPSCKLEVGNGSSTYVKVRNAASGDISSGYNIMSGSTTTTSLYGNAGEGWTTLLSGGALNFRVNNAVSGFNPLGIATDGTVAFTEIMKLDGNNAYFISTAANGYRFNNSNDAFNNMIIAENGNVTIRGALSKGSGSFRIPHPVASKTATHDLVHSFLEAPQADNLYRGKVDLVAGTATVNIDTVAGMTEGTFAALNREVQCFTSNETGWTAVKGSVSGNTLTITAQDNSCTDTISWMVVGERKDQHMYDTDWTDANGKVIVEPTKRPDKI